MDMRCQKRLNRRHRYGGEEATVLEFEDVDDTLHRRNGNDDDNDDDDQVEDLEMRVDIVTVVAVLTSRITMKICRKISMIWT